MQRRSLLGIFSGLWQEGPLPRLRRGETEGVDHWLVSPRLAIFPMK